MSVLTFVSNISVITMSYTSYYYYYSCYYISLLWGKLCTKTARNAIKNFKYNYYIDLQ